MARRLSSKAAKPSMLPAFATLDFEASSLGSASFPIEVGIAIGGGHDPSVSVWSTLILPHPTWSLTSAWDRKSERVHGISASALAAGMAPAAVLAHLNSLLAPFGCAWCDGGDYDRFWFERLCKAAPLVRPAFAVRDLSGMDLSHGERSALAALLAQSNPEHRAGPDAERICRAVTEVRGRRL